MIFLKSFVEIFFLMKRVPLRNLLIFKSSINGRGGPQKKIVLRARGGRKKIVYKIVDFFRVLYYIPAVMCRFEFDNNRNVFLVLLCYENGFLSYIVAPSLVRFGFSIVSGFRVPLKFGNFMLVKNYFLGTLFHNLTISRFSKIARSAGVYIQILKKIGNFIVLRLPSKEERLFNVSNLFGTFGVIANDIQKLRFSLKASDNIRKGKKSIVRGVAKNAVDHPHGGGSGRASSGIPSESLWGWYTKGLRTSTKFWRYGGNLKWKILKRRKIKKQRKR